MHLCKIDCCGCYSQSELEKPGQKRRITGKTVAIEGRLGSMGISVGCNLEKTWGG